MARVELQSWQTNGDENRFSRNRNYYLATIARGLQDVPPEQLANERKNSL